MAKFVSTIINDKNVWERFVLLNKPQSFLQSWNWGETQIYCGAKVLRLGIFKGHKLVGVAQIIEQVAKRGKHMLIPGGPLIDWDNSELVSFFLDDIKRLARKSGVWFVRLRAELPGSSENRAKFRRLGFVKAPMHLHAENTWLLDINPQGGEDQLLADMRKTTRYLVKKSLTYGFELVKTNDVKKSQVLFELQKDTLKRHKFVGFSKNIFEGQLATFGKDNEAELYIGSYNGKFQNAAIIIYYGDTAYYHHSASSDTSKNIPIAYYLQWRVIQEARKRGLAHYNFWGVAPSDNPRHRFYGVTLFKKGFGGRQVDFLPAQDLPISPLYFLTYIFEMSRKVLRRL